MLAAMRKSNAVDARTREARPVDAYVGARIRFRRKLFGISQMEMGNRIGVTFQQVQKYEKGSRSSLLPPSSW